MRDSEKGSSCRRHERLHAITERISEKENMKKAAKIVEKQKIQIARILEMQWRNIEMLRIRGDLPRIAERLTVLEA